MDNIIDIVHSVSQYKKSAGNGVLETLMTGLNFQQPKILVFSVVAKHFV